jgi:putative SOS response-associated peptidase YedK
MCNLYSLTKGQAAIIALVRALRDITGNMPPLPGIFPDYRAPIVRTALDGVRELAMARWGMPSSQRALLDAAKKRAQKVEAKGKSVDFNVQFVQIAANTASGRLSSRANQMLPPAALLNSLKEVNGTRQRCSGPSHRFQCRLSVLRMFVVPLSGSMRRSSSVRKVKEGETTNDLFGFLTTEPNLEVGAVHPKAMPVILTTPEEIELWMTAPAEQALKLQRPLPNGALKVVAIGGPEDRDADNPAEPAAPPKL